MQPAADGFAAEGKRSAAWLRLESAVVVEAGKQALPVHPARHRDDAVAPSNAAQAVVGAFGAGEGIDFPALIGVSTTFPQAASGARLLVGLAVCSST